MVKFGAAETQVACQLHGIKPKFRAVGITFHMNVRRLVPIGRVEKETVWPITMDSRCHVLSIVSSSDVSTQSDIHRGVHSPFLRTAGTVLPVHRSTRIIRRTSPVLRH